MDYCWFWNHKQEHNRVRCLWRGKTKCQGQEAHKELLYSFQFYRDYCLVTAGRRYTLRQRNNTHKAVRKARSGMSRRGKSTTQKATLGGLAACKHYLLSPFFWHALAVLEQSWSNGKQLSLCQKENASHLYAWKGRSPWKCFIFPAKIWLKGCWKP